MHKTLYDAAVAQLRGSALESLSIIEIILKNPSAAGDHSTCVEEITAHARNLAETEGAMLTLNQYFGKHFSPKAPPVNQSGVLPPPMAPPRAPRDPGPPMKVTPEISPTYRREAEKEKIRSSVKAAPAATKTAKTKTKSKKK